MTDRTHEIATLITQLRVLAQLTRTEAQVARLRVAQARTDAARDELRQNAADADGRAARISSALRDLGALTDPVTPLLGGVAALVRGALEQAQPLDEAVLGDLALEHQLRDRGCYVAALADAAGRTEVRQLADDLVAAHTETADWLRGVLADLGAGTPTALGASPLQQVAAQVTHVANRPARPALDKVGAGVVRTVDSVAGVAGAARDTAEQATGAVADTGQGDTEPDADEAPPAEPPIPGLADLPTHAAVAALRALDDPRDIAAVLAFERAHGNRAAVLVAADLRAAGLG